MRYFPHILRTVRMGRTRVLPIRPVLRDARNLPAPIISVIIGLPLPVFATACILLPVACPSLARRLPAACSACSARSSQPACRSRCSSLPAAPACPPFCPPFCLLCLLCRSACSSPPACKKSETLKSLAFLLSGLGLRQPPPDFLRVSPENLPGRAARGSWPNRPRDVSLRR